MAQIKQEISKNLSTDEQADLPQDHMTDDAGIGEITGDTIAGDLSAGIRPLLKICFYNYLIKYLRI